MKLELSKKRINTLIKCPNCEYEGECKAGRNGAIQFIFLVGGFFSYGLLWIGWLIYIMMTKNCICPKCDNKQVVKK